MTDTTSVTVPVDLKKPDPLVIHDGDGKLLFAIRSDGSVEGVGSEHEAAQRLVDAMRIIAPEIFEAPAPEGGAVYGPGGYLVKDFADGWYWTPNAALDHARGAPVWSVANNRYETDPPALATREGAPAEAGLVQRTEG